jgi:ketosteroid isomerase-like protein
MAQIKNMLKEIYEDGDVNAMTIFKGYAVDTNQSGWHYRNFGRSEHHFMGKSVAEAREYVDDVKATREVIPWAFGSEQ